MAWRLLVITPSNRDYAGSLQLFDPDGRLQLGPLPVSTRADLSLARRFDNPGRDPTRRFGDVGLGVYALQGEVSPKQTRTWGAAEYGPFGALMFQPKSGDAAIGEANGRFELVLHGGDLSKERLLRPSAGALRLRNEDLQQLLSKVQEAAGDLVCECVAGEPAGRPQKLSLSGQLAGPPPYMASFGAAEPASHSLFSVAATSVSRRRLLQGGVAAFVGSVASLGPARFAWADATSGTMAVAQLAYGDDNGQVFDVLPVVPADTGEEIIRDVVVVPGPTVVVPGVRVVAPRRVFAPTIRPQPLLIVPARRKPGALPAPYISVRDQAIQRSIQVIGTHRGPAATSNIKSVIKTNASPKLRGAFDISTQGAKDPLKEASDIRDSLGPGFVVIYENPDLASKTQTNTVFFSNGTSKIMSGKLGTNQYKATEPHIHVQPDPSLFAKGS